MVKQYSLIDGDALSVLRAIESRSVQTCVTSPPYWSLRDYGVEGQIGSEKTVEGYVANLVEVFKEVRRVLVNDGTLWLILGDCFAGRSKKPNANAGLVGRRGKRDKPSTIYTRPEDRPRRSVPKGLKEKDLIGLPWRVAFALQSDGWWLRSDIIWSKSNPMPENVRDRPTRSHEYIFLFSKSKHYYFDASQFRENCVDGLAKRNRRSVWNVPTRPYSEAHFATFPVDLVEPCILAGCPTDGLVLDCFSGAATTGLVALQHNRRYCGIDLNGEYNKLAGQRLESGLA